MSGTAQATPSGFTVEDHGALLGLGDDDHLQYALLAGRLLGQTLIGGLDPTEELGLRGSADADLGIVRAFSPVIIDDIIASPIQQAFQWSSTFTASAPFIGGMIRDIGTVTYTNAFFIWALLAESRRYEAGVDPGFAAFTLFNVLPTIVNDGPFNLVQALVVNIGVVHERSTAGTSTTVHTIGMNFGAQARASLSGAVMTFINGMTAVNFSPTFSTVVGSTINFGTLRGLHAVNPAVALFQTAAGVETMTAYYAVDVAAIPFGGNVPKAALRSALTFATLARFLENTGGAESEFGTGDIHFNDSTAVKFGNTLAAPDMFLFWDPSTSAFRFSPFFGTGGNPLDFRGTALDEWIMGGPGLGDIGLAFDVNAIVFGDVLPTPNTNNWFVLFSAPNLRQVQVGGEYSDVLWTAGGSIDVNGLTVTDLQAFKINSPAVILNGGTIDDISNLFLDGMPSFGATLTQALRVLGRARVDGHVNQGSQSPAAIIIDQNDYQLGQNNNQRGVALISASSARTITGIDSSFGFAQIGDRVTLYNVGSFAITLTHQDVLSAAANRIITSTGVAYIIGPGDMVDLWYDDTGTLRWRMFAGTGA
jgi:hypothetical protein